MTQNKITSIKNIDPDIYRQAKAAAALAGMTVGQWICKVIKEKLKGEKK